MSGRLLRRRTESKTHELRWRRKEIKIAWKRRGPATCCLDNQCSRAIGKERIVVQRREDREGCGRGRRCTAWTVTARSNLGENPPRTISGVNERRTSWWVIDVLLSKVGLKLSTTHVHKSTALAMHTCRSRARVPHNALHRCWIVELTRHAHLHLQHGVDHVHTQAS